MKKEEFMEAREIIQKIENLLTESNNLFDKLPLSIREAILKFHNESAALGFCLRWGLQAAKEIREDWHVVVAGLDVENNGGEEVKEMEKITVNLSKPILLDKLNALAAEYDVSVELLVNLAVMRLIDDVEFLRDLRAGKIKTE